MVERDELRLGYCAARQIADLGKSSGIAHGNVGQHFAIQRHIGLLQAIHEPAVAEAVLARRGVDAGDPQAAEITLAIAAIPVGISQRLEHRLVGAAEQEVLGALLTPGKFEYFAVAVASRHATFYPCHFCSASFYVLELFQIRSQPLDAPASADVLCHVGVAVGRLDCRRLLAAQVSLALTHAHQFACAGVFETLSCRFVRLDLRHVRFSWLASTLILN